jgi:hypothetical protein
MPTGDFEASRFTEAGSAPNEGYSSVDAHMIAYGPVQPWLDINWVYQTAPTFASGAQRCYSQSKPRWLGEDRYELDHSIIARGKVTAQCDAVALFNNCLFKRYRLAARMCSRFSSR